MQFDLSNDVDRFLRHHQMPVFRIFIADLVAGGAKSAT